MKHMILSFKMKGDVISDHILMLWFQKDSLDTVSFRTFRERGPRFLNKIVEFPLSEDYLRVRKRK